jgi:diguanylate cyclase (GGDEF)-like protein
LPTITANAPVYSYGSQQLLGVCATDVILSEELNRFLQNLDISSSGIAFIVEPSGLLIASSTPEPITQGEGKATVLLAAKASSNPLIRETHSYLSQKYQSLEAAAAAQLDFVWQNRRYFLPVSRFVDGLGLDWILVLVVPEDDFMEPIYTHNQVTFLFYGLSLLIATAIGLLLAKWMTHPLHQLSARAREIARGDWQQPIEIDHVLEQEWRRLARAKKPLTLMLCDVDHFKRYNDTHGHQAGDQCLRKVAQVFTQTVHRPADLVARYGGEEFAIILPNTDTAGAVNLAQQIQDLLQKLAILHAATTEGQITVSIGIATTIPHLEASPEALIQATDRALYDAKGVAPK